MVTAVNRTYFPYGDTLSSSLSASIEVEVHTVGMPGFTTAQYVQGIDEKDDVVDPFGAKSLGLKRQFNERGPYDLVIVLGCARARVCVRVRACLRVHAASR